MRVTAIEEQVHIQRTENPDSLEIGSPSKGGVKVYGNFADEKAFRDKMLTALALLKEAKDNYDGLNKPVVTGA